MTASHVRINRMHIDTLIDDLVPLVERPQQVTAHMPAGWSVLGVTDEETMSIHLIVRRGQTVALHLWVKPSMDGLATAGIESFVEGVGQDAFNKLLSRVHAAVEADAQVLLAETAPKTMSINDVFGELQSE